MQFQMWKYRLNTTGYKWWKGRSNFFTSIPATSLYLLFLIYFSCFITLYMYIINSNFVLNWKVLKKERRILLYILCTNFICCRGGSRGAWAPPSQKLFCFYRFLWASEQIFYSSPLLWNPGSAPVLNLLNVSNLLFNSKRRSV